MDSGQTVKNGNPRDKANTLSILVWWWTIRLFKKGYSKVLGPDDLYAPLREDRSNRLGDRLEKKWTRELKTARERNRSPSLLFTIIRTFIWEYSILGMIQILNEFVLGLGTPLLLGGLLQYFKPEPTTTYENALLCAGGIALTNAIQMITVNQNLYGCLHIGGRIRVAVCSLVYRKALRLDKAALGETAPGKIVNLVANDVNRFDIISNFAHHMWSAPTLTFIVAVILYFKAGYAGLFGILAIFVVVPIQSYAGKLSSRFRLQTALKTDERVRFMDEIISGIQVIKMYSWEKPFCALIELARRLELRVVMKNSYIRAIYMTFNLFTTRAALYCTLMAMLYFGEEITADKVFVFSSFFNILTHTMTGMFVRGFAETAECMVAVRRLQTFLTYDEYKQDNVVKNLLLATKGKLSPDLIKSSQKIDKMGNLHEIQNIDEMNEKNLALSDNKESPIISADYSWSIKFNHVTAKWNSMSSDPTLNNIDLEIEKGKLYILIGMVGSGKSSLLSAILGELNLVSGQVEVDGKVSYADQESWVFGASVRQNILFGQEFKNQKYQKVVNVCALRKDFEQFPHADQTIVGERGSSLSGGQKARVNLARAVYREADIYLLDDPLSAVDTHVGKHLFEECIQNYLRGKTRILATHQLQFVKGADSILLIDDGRIHQYKDYHELLRAHPEYDSLVAEEESEEKNDDPSSTSDLVRRNVLTSSAKSTTSESSCEDICDNDQKQDANKLSDFIEGTSKGVVKGSLLWKYLTIGTNLPTALLLVILFLLSQFIASTADLYTKEVVKSEESRSYYNHLDEFYIEKRLNSSSNVTLPAHSSKLLPRDEIKPVETYVSIYSCLIVSIFIIGIIRALTFYGVCLNSSQRLHDLVFGAIIRASMRFFDTNSSGRILNRFSKDMQAIDELLPKALLDAFQILLICTGSIIISCVVNPIFIVPILVIGFIFFFIRKIYLRTSKNIKRLEGMTKSPVFTHLNATLNGLSTIRALGAEKILEKEFDNLQDIHTASWYMYTVTSMAFGFTLDFFCLIFISMVLFSFLLLKNNFSGGDVGLAVTQVISLAGTIQWGIRQAAEAANQLMAVERVLEYSVIPNEPNLRNKDPRQKRRKKQADKEVAFLEPPSSWPAKGQIEFKRVYMRYSENDPYVLQDLSLTIHPSKKVGIVGRTGAGKSSLISALFRLAKVEGVIKIDGIDTGRIAIEDLRKHISIIPQMPVLFSGTLRRNLDPFNEFSDDHLWAVLDEVELKDAVVATGNGLENRVMDHGSNYSVGQRQLICLARAILRNNRVLMLDEATANVDPQTDALIQRTIRTKFASCTVLTVAHRLNTIMDSDKVLVMDKGRLKEYDHPHILLQDENSEFTSLVKETGQAMYEQLCEVARESYSNEHFNTRL
ncbi:hypothetical protein QAD02_022876 [Eretmocerus hayati]|uniref:Uncharacterized protein n=1 Tax=Eretmocerus hayati TaxID=131215 RepID=A0ACC2PUF9_9HYME|nr:hypothetical protein QAD02_022876 [Eretmocerus hayati]